MPAARPTPVPSRTFTTAYNATTRAYHPREIRRARRVGTWRYLVPPVCDPGPAGRPPVPGSSQLAPGHRDMTTEVRQQAIVAADAHPVGAAAVPQQQVEIGGGAGDVAVGRARFAGHGQVALPGHHSPVHARARTVGSRARSVGGRARSVGGVDRERAGRAIPGSALRAAADEAHDHLVDAVGGEPGGERRPVPGLPRAGGGLVGVHPVDGRFVRLPAGPERHRRRRLKERPAGHVGFGRLQDPHQGGVTLAEPGEQLVVFGPTGQDLRLRCPVDPPGMLLPHVSRCPSVHVAEVPEQLAHAPARAGGDRRVEPGALRGAGQELTFAPQARDVVRGVRRAVLRCVHAAQHALPGARAHSGAAAGGPPAWPGPRLPCALRLCDHGTKRRAWAEGGPRVTAQYPAMSLADIDLSDTEFWARPLAERQAAFATLRAAERPPFFAEPETPFAERGPGYYALVRHTDVVAASRNPGVFSSGRGATSIPDLPAEFNEYFGSMINMDDP